MADGTLAALAKRVEAEEPSTRLWLEVFRIVFPEPDYVDIEEWVAWIDSLPQFERLVDYGAYLDAAEMLRPIDCEWHAAVDGNTRCNGVLFKSGVHDIIVDVTGPHAEARARLSAALRARDAGGV